MLPFFSQFTIYHDFVLVCHRKCHLWIGACRSDVKNVKKPKLYEPLYKEYILCQVKRTKHILSVLSGQKAAAAGGRFWKETGCLSKIKFHHLQKWKEKKMACGNIEKGGEKQHWEWVIMVSVCAGGKSCWVYEWRASCANGADEALQSESRL